MPRIPGDPGSGPIVRPKRRRGKRKAAPTQPPSTEALKGRAYGSRPARPNPKPTAPAYKPPVNDTKSDADRGRADKFKRTPQYKADVRATYHAASPERKQELADQADKRSVEGRVILEEHAARKRLIQAATNTGGDFGGSNLRYDNTPEGRRLAEEASKHPPEKHSLVETPGVAAGLKALEQTTRPLHALAGAAKEDVKVAQDKGLGYYLTHGGGEAAIHAASRGIQNKDHVTFSDVLKQAGVKNKFVRGTGGFVLDVVLDPTTYLTGGLGGVSKKAAADAAEMAAAHGADEATQAAIRARVGKAAEEHAAKHLEQRGRGVQVGLRFHIPFTDITAHPQGVIPGTRAIGHAKPVRAVRRKVRESAVVQKTAGNLAPDFRPAGVSPIEHQAVRAAERRLRAAQGATKERAAATKRSLRRAVPDAARQADVMAAVERAPVKPLTDVETRTVRTPEYEARLAARKAKRNVETARRAEAHARGRAEVAASAGTKRTIREAVAEADRHAKTAQPSHNLGFKPGPKAEPGRGIVTPDGKLVTVPESEMTHVQLRESQGLPRTRETEKFGKESIDLYIRPNGTFVIREAPVGMTEAQAAIRIEHADHRLKWIKHDQITDAERAAHTPAEVSPHQAAADHVVTQFKEASKVRNRASTELSNAGKAFRNSHENAPKLYSDAERAKAATRLEKAKKTMAHAKIDYEHAKKALHDFGDYAAGKAAAGPELHPPGKFYHVADTRHRDSILEKGLIGNRAPGNEAFPAVYVHAKHPGKVSVTSDIWEVSPEGMRFLDDVMTEGAKYTKGNIPIDKLRLLERRGEASQLRHLDRKPAAALRKLEDRRGKLAAAEAEHAAAQAATKGQRVVKKHERVLFDKQTGRRVRDINAESPKVTPESIQDTAVAQHVERELAGMNEAEIAAGARSASSTREDYFPHVHESQTKRGDKLTRKQRKKARRFGADKKRQIEGTLRELDARQAAGDTPNPFTGDLAAAMASRVEKSGGRVANAQFFHDVAASGRKLDKAEVDEGYGAYVLEQGKLKKLDKDNGQPDLAAIEQAIKSGKDVHQLNEKLIDPHIEALSHTSNPGLWSALMRGWKYSVTQVLPSYHIGNLIGDTILAHEADTSAGAFAKAAKVTKVHNRMGAHAESAAAAQGVKFESKGTVRIQGERMKITDLVREAEREGAIQTGAIGKELKDLGGKSQGPVSKTLSDFSSARENLPRFATYISARNRGMSAREAAEWTNKHHIDYGDLTEFEQKLRSTLIPFYTFNARNTRIQAAKLVTRPGKAATLQKVREEAIKAAGLDPATFDDTLKDYQQRGAPIPVKYGKRILNYFARTPIEQGLQFWPKVSTTPGAASLYELANNVVNMTGPIKLAVELPQAYSFFFRDKIEDPENHTDFKKAPAYVGQLPKAMRDYIGIQKGSDGWYWPGRVDYLAKAMPETKMALDLTTEGKNRTGRSPGQSALGIAGIRVDPYDPKDNQQAGLTGLYNKRQKIADQVSAMQHLKTDRTKDRKAYTPRYRRLLDEQNALNKRIEAAQKASGDPPDPRVKRRRKGRKSTLPSLGSGGGSGFKPIGGGGGSGGLPSLSGG